MDDGIPGNSAAFTNEETQFELIGTSGWTFSFMHAANGFAEAAGTELRKGKQLVDVHVADIKLDSAGT